MTFETSTITSKDGTTIGYRYTGTGPGLVICHGGGRISQNYIALTEHLASKFTAYIPDRRGRGLSGPEGMEYGIDKACDDLIAILDHTGAEYVFGHSAGGLIALETALRRPVKKLVLYEPPVSVDGSLPAQWLGPFEQAIAQGKLKKAMALSLKGLKVVDGIDKMPLTLLLLLINIISFAERKKERGTRMLDLLHTLPADMKMAIALDSQYERYRDIHIPTLLMYGAKSPLYFGQGTEALHSVIGRSQLVSFPGLDHYSPEGSPKEIATQMIQFFGHAHTE